MQKIETELAALRARAETLSNRHAAADAALVDAKANLQRHHLEADIDADDKVRARLEAAIAAATLTRDGFADALTDLQAKIGNAERKLADERAAAQRKTASEELARNLNEVERTLPVLLDAARHHVAALEAIHFHHETIEMSRFLSNAMAQMEIASAFAVQELRGMVNAIREGSSPIPPKPQPAAITVTEPPLPTKTAFMLESARFTDHDGRRKFVGQWSDATMPAPIAERALRHGIAVPTTHPMRETHRGMRGSDYVADGPDVVDLDQLDDRSGAIYEPPGTQHDAASTANFKRIDRGGAITGTIAAARAP